MIKVFVFISLQTEANPLSTADAHYIFAAWMNEYINSNTDFQQRQMLLF